MSHAEPASPNSSQKTLTKREPASTRRRAGRRLATADALIAATAAAHRIPLLTRERDFANLDWRRFKDLAVVLDGRGAVDPNTVRDAGATYLAIGVRPS